MNTVSFFKTVVCLRFFVFLGTSTLSSAEERVCTQDRRNEFIWDLNIAKGVMASYETQKCKFLVKLKATNEEKYSKVIKRVCKKNLVSFLNIKEATDACPFECNAVVDDPCGGMIKGSYCNNPIVVDYDKTNCPWGTPSGSESVGCGTYNGKEAYCSPEIGASACVYCKDEIPNEPSTSPSPTTSPTSNPTTSPTSNLTTSPSSNPTEVLYDKFLTPCDLKEAVYEYCYNPEAWTTNSKYAKYGPIEKWDVSSIDDMSKVFSGQSNCNPNIADWDVSAVTNFYRMFYFASSFNQDIGGWDVSKGTRFGWMFYYASSFNQDIGGWDVSKGTTFDRMFESASSFNQDIGGWDVSKGTRFYSMFRSAISFNQDIGGWDVSNGRTFDGMFESASSFNQDIGGWDVSNGYDFDYIFYKASSFNQDIGGWDVSNGTTFYRMFYMASSFNQDIGGWDVSKGTNFNYMFLDASSFNQDLCDWDINDSAYTYYFCYGAISCGACSF